METDADWYHRFGSVIEKYTKSIYEKKPLIDSISSTPEGNILVSGVRENDRSPTIYWLLDEDGKILRRITSTSQIANITKNFIIYTTQDETMNITVRCMRRSGKERDDLLMIETMQ